MFTGVILPDLSIGVKIRFKVAPGCTDMILQLLAAIDQNKEVFCFAKPK
jgi:hypothetical protein